MSLLTYKPQDPVPHIYSILKEVQKGVEISDSQPITENELNEMLNLQKKVDYFKQLLHENEKGDETVSSDNDSDEEDEI